MTASRATLGARMLEVSLPRVRRALRCCVGGVRKVGAILWQTVVESKYKECVISWRSKN